MLGCPVIKQHYGNDTGFDIHMCNVSISNKTTEAFEFLTGTIGNMELKHRGPLLTNVLKLRNVLQCNCGLSSVTRYARAPELAFTLFRVSTMLSIIETLAAVKIILHKNSRTFL